MKSEEYLEIKKEITQLWDTLEQLAILLGRVSAIALKDPVIKKMTDEIFKHRRDNSN